MNEVENVVEKWIIGERVTLNAQFIAAESEECIGLNVGICRCGVMCFYDTKAIDIQPRTFEHIRKQRTKSQCRALLVKSSKELM
jgi:transketolase C-terminal domain/subunit